MYWIFDLEPLEERYTSQMREWVKREFDNHKLDYRFVTPKVRSHTGKIIDWTDDKDNNPIPLRELVSDVLTTTVENGSVLDAVGTNYYKAKQMAYFMELLHTPDMVKKGDKLLIFDFQYPGLEAIRYTSDLLGLDLEIYAVCHASSYVQGDFTEPMAPWLQFFEHGWWAICDKIFVGSEYHKQAIMERRNAEHLEDKIVVTGNAYWNEGIRDTCDNMTPPKERMYDIVFSNRWDTEKNIRDFIDLLMLIDAKATRDIQVVITTSRQRLSDGSAEIDLDKMWYLRKRMDHVKITTFEGVKKQGYYNVLDNSKVFVSTSIEEMFGYCVAEAVTLACHPVVYNIASHPELLENDERYLANNIEDMRDKVLEAIDNPDPSPRYMMKYDTSIAHMIQVMEGAYDADDY